VQYTYTHNAGLFSAHAK